MMCKHSGENLLKVPAPFNQHKVHGDDGVFLAVGNVCHGGA
jgi:hypothetical protein